MQSRLLVLGGSILSLLPPTLPQQRLTPAWSFEGGQGGAYLGGSVANAGDVNGDGFQDVVVGAWGYDNGAVDAGQALVFHGSATGPAALPSWTMEGNQVDAYLGASVASAGDVNGDGYFDVIVGAPGYGPTFEGRALVFLGSPIGLDALPSWFIDGIQALEQLGLSVASAGDVNGDGYDDVIVGARGYENGQVHEGRALLYLGSMSGLAGSATWTAESDQGAAQFGNAVAGLGDVNGDGYDDVGVGAYYYSDTLGLAGRAYVFLGSASGVDSSPSWTVDGDQVLERFGSAVAGAGDVNGDGYDDFLVGAWGYDYGGMNTGRAFLYLGSLTGPQGSPAWSLDVHQSGGHLGASIDGAGDVNADGYADVIVGSDGFDMWKVRAANRSPPGRPDEGRVQVFLGSPAGLSGTASWTVTGNMANAHLGFCAAGAGDVNGDGYDDVLAGAWGFSNGQGTEGRALLYLGAP